MTARWWPPSDSQSAAEEAASDLEAVTARTLGQTYTIDEDLLQYSSGLLRRQDLVDETTLEEDLSQEIGLVTRLTACMWTGSSSAPPPMRARWRSCWASCRARTADENTISCEFAEDVEISRSTSPRRS